MTRARIEVCWGLVVALGFALALIEAHAQGVPGAKTAADNGARDRQTMERFLELLEKNPRRGIALERVYGYHIERGSLETFLKNYHDRTARDANDGTAWLLLGLFEAQRGRDAAAVAALKKAESTRPNDPLAPYYLGQALVLVGQPDAAAAAFERAIERKPTRTDLLPIFQALGRVHQRAYHTAQALEVWNRLEALFPDDVRVQEQIAATLAEENEPAKALPRYESLAKKTTDPYRKVQFRIEAAELKVRLSRTKDALRDFESLLGQLNPDSWLYRDVRRRIEEAFLRNDDQAGLAAYYEGWVKQSPEDVEAMSRLARSLAGLGRNQEARSWFDKAVKLAPTRKALRQALIDQLVHDKKIGEAAAQYEALAKADPNNPDIIRDWGRLLLRDTALSDAERKTTAGAVWRKLIEARPNDAPTVVLTAELFRQADMPNEAEALYRKAIALAPDSIQYYEYLGEFYHRQQRPKDALETWSKIADGKNRNAKNLGRLAEVLAGFGYVKEALVPSMEACRMAPDDFNLQFKNAEWLLQLEQYDDVLKQLDVVGKAADAPEQIEAELALRIKTYQKSGQLEKQIETLRAELDAGREATAARWRRLARFDEAARRFPEASAAIDRAVALDEKSVSSWMIYARIHEDSGDHGGAVMAYRKLASLDNRSRGAYLREVAKLELKLGRRDNALKAGREVLAAAPGNRESYEFFADLCMQLGEVDEGLDALRRAVRVDPNDKKALTTLAEALAREFRTEEAIELYWKAFERTPELDSRLALIAKLTDLHLQRNLFDRLIARLEREQRDAKQPREMTLCLAQAYQSSGDFGEARVALEGLLAANPRDVVLLRQLQGLAEAETDFAGAAKYQAQINELSPSDDGAVHLAQLYYQAGEATEAETVWARLAGGKQAPERVFQAIDSLLNAEKAQTALEIVERFLREHPGSWEGLYREGIVLARLGKNDEAERRFRTIFNLQLAEDTESEGLKAAKRSQPGRVGDAHSRNSRDEDDDSPRAARNVQAVWFVRRNAQFEQLNRAAFLSRGMSSWSPSDFGQARVGALSWLIQLAEKQSKLDALIQEFRTAKENAPDDPRPLWDWYYVCTYREQYREAYETALALSRRDPQDPSSLWAYFRSLPSRARQVRESNPRLLDEEESENDNQTPPLDAKELEHVLACYKAFARRKLGGSDLALATTVAAELTRANRKDEADRLFKDASSVQQELDLNRLFSILSNERVDVDTALDTLDRFLARGGKAEQGQSMDQLSLALIQLMNRRAKVEAHADVWKVLDHYFDWYGKPERVARRLQTIPSTKMRSSDGVAFVMPVGNKGEFIQIKYPPVNAYYNAQSLQILRAGFEFAKRGDQVAGLLEHARQRVEKAPESSRGLALLALGYLQWWNDDRDESVRTLSKAVDLVKGDPELRISLAELQAERGEHDDALATLERVEAFDQQILQRRELMALRLAALTGNVARARLAAERLFNLRLDTNLQLQLAGQMHQLGMHDLAEAVLSRARRRAGSDAETLVALMEQYQAQNNVDVAVQIARQILRRAPAPKRSRLPFQNDDGGRRRALDVLARSDKLKELIDRVEAQLETSPNSVELLQSLADYHKAAKQPAKARAALDRIAKLRADDPQTRFKMALQLAETNDNAGAVEHFKAALAKSPALMAPSFYQVQTAFQKAGKMDDLIGIIEAADLSKVGGYFWIEQIVEQQLGDSNSRERALRLFRKMWQAFPNDRLDMLANMDEESFWTQPEVYNYVHEAIVPPPGQRSIARWAGLDSANTLGGADGTLVQRLLQAAEAQNKLDALAQELAQSIQRFPQWSGGEVLLALVKVRQRKVDDAKKDLEAALAKETKKAPMPSSARTAVAEQIKSDPTLLPIAIRLYETAVKQDSNRDFFNYSSHPARRLAILYGKAGRAADGRELIVDLARRSNENARENSRIAGMQLRHEVNEIARDLLSLGFPADAVSIYNGIYSNPETMREISADGMARFTLDQMHKGMNQALGGLDDRTLAPSLRALLRPGQDNGGQAIDLVVLVNPRELERAELVSFGADILRAASKQAELAAEMKTALAVLASRSPNDFSVVAAQSLAASYTGASTDFESAAKKLVELADANPLERLDESTRPTSRQRAEASKRLGLWFVARICWTKAETASLGDRLATIALESGQRQVDPLLALAQMREWGQTAQKRGDSALSQRLSAQMLEKVLATAPANEAVAGADEIRKDAERRPTVAAMTLDRFELVMQVAQNASQKGTLDLSLRAVRESLRGGPPVAPITLKEDALFARRPRFRFDDDEQVRSPTKVVEERITALEYVWRSREADPVVVYETLRDVVLPDARPTEVFLYPQPLAGTRRQPRSAAAHLARWAVTAQRVEDLKSRIKARHGDAQAALDADVLGVLVGLAGRDFFFANARLEALSTRMRGETTETAAERVCLAGLPALDEPKTLAAAVTLLTQAVSRLPDSPFRSELFSTLARAHFRLGNVDEGRKHLREIRAAVTRAVPDNDSYARFVRKQQLQGVAAEFARAGQWADTLDTLGQFVDAPSFEGGDPSLGTVLTSLAIELAKAPARDRYERLKTWTMPTKTRKSIRMLASFAPRETPPRSFGAFSTEPFDDGVVSTSGLLIDAARAAGKLDELLQETRELVDKKVENADALWLLAELARGSSSELNARLKTRAEALKTTVNPEEIRPEVSWADLLIARAGLRNRDLPEDLGREFATLVLTRAVTLEGAIATRLRYDLARRQAERAGASAVLDHPEPGLAYWHTASVSSAHQYAQGPPPQWWVESERHIKHLTGSGDQMLLFDVPLGGTFEFSVDAWQDTWAAGGVGYGGLVCDAEPNSFSGVFPIGGSERLILNSPFIVNHDFNRLTVQVAPDEVRYLVNGHLFYRDTKPSPTSPWLTLFCTEERQTTFRNIRITGAPIVLSQVPLTRDDRLEGWTSRFFDQSQSPRWPPPKQTSVPDTKPSDSARNEYDWVAQDSQIRCRKVESSADRSAVESRLYYIRPLRAGDALSYEFYYEPNEIIAHPALDRLAFLLEPDGVKLHWITDGAYEWSGLKSDNVVDEPGVRRGPDRLPLKPREWNQARVAIEGNTAVIVVNGVEVARRPLEPENSRQFGLFHFRDRSAAQIRNVVLTGNWPKTLPSDLMAREPSAKTNPAESVVCHELVGEEVLSESASFVLKSARAMPDSKRYDYLREWVLPRDDKPDFRLAVSYTPTGAAPPVASVASNPRDNSSDTRVSTGGALECPVMELVATAQRLGKLDELLLLVERNPSSDERVVRERVALCALIHMAQDRDDAARDDLQKLLALVRARPKDNSPVWQRAPEQVAQWASLGRPALRKVSDDLIAAQIQDWSDLAGKSTAIANRDLWGLHLLHAARRSELLATPPDRRTELDAATRLPLWSRVEHATAASRGSGCPTPRWRLENGILRHEQGHREDFLYLNVPIQGDFELTCEVQGFGSNQMQLAYAAIMTTLRPDRKTLDIAHFGKPVRERVFDPPLEDGKGWYPLRLTVKNGKYTVFMKGQQIYEDFLPKSPDPWLAIHQRATGSSGLRALKLTGNPTVPESLSLSTQSDLTGWLADYYEERIDGDHPSWMKKGDEIIAPNFGSDDAPTLSQWDSDDIAKLQTAARLGSKQESLLQYHRPLLEDGAIEYEFFYAPGKTLVHPALDRLAMMLDPKGVKLHWLTDGKYDRTELAPDNVVDEPRDRRGVASLPLKPDAWNRATLSLKGDVVSLALNGDLVFERVLEPTNGRQFGLFHYADETEARVRNVVYRGAWPKSVPADLFGIETPATDKRDEEKGGKNGH